jgi:hypothetical protein
MPLLNYQLFIFFRKFFGFGQFAEFDSLRFAQFDLFLHVKHCFTATIADVNVNWAVLVAVKEKPKTVLLKNRWHSFDYFNQCAGARSQTCEPMNPAPPVTRKFMAKC